MFVLGQYTMIIFKRTKIISLMTSWYSKNHLHRSLIFYKIEHHKKVHEKFMSNSSLFEDRKELWKWSQPYILVQISSFLCVFPPQWIHNDLNCTFIYISSYENLSVYSITANANQTETWVSYIFIHCYNCMLFNNLISELNLHTAASALLLFPLNTLNFVNQLVLVVPVYEI